MTTKIPAMIIVVEKHAIEVPGYEVYSLVKVLTTKLLGIIFTSYIN